MKNTVVQLLFLSIHDLLAEVDRYGARGVPRAKSFQFTTSSRRSTFHFIFLHDLIILSIHDLLAEIDKRPDWFIPVVSLSIHDLLAEVDHSERTRGVGVNLSIHDLLAEVDRPSRMGNICL